MALRDGQEPRRPAFMIHSFAKESSGAEQFFDCPSMAPSSSQVQWRLAILVNGVGTGFGDHQQGVDHIGVACGGCQVQRRPAALTRHLHLGFGMSEGIHHVHMPSPSRQVQWCVAKLCGTVEERSTSQQLPDHIHMTLGSCPMEGGLA